MKAVRCWSDADAEVWCIDVSQPLAAGEMQQLSEDELARAARFVQERDSRRYLGSRHALRCMLAGVTGLRVEDIAIGRGPHGKPFMVGHAGWRFSLSRRIDVVALSHSLLPRRPYRHLRHQQGQWFAEHLFFGIPEYGFCRPVPRNNKSAAISGHNRVIRRFGK